jgi:CheY-like chemotaxis protein
VAAVISDLQLPGMSGMDFLSRLRSESRFAQVPVLIISGDTDPLAPQDALSRGASAYFTKPYSPSEIRRKLEQLLK